MLTAPENGNDLITSLVLIDRGTIKPTLSALKTVLDGGNITLYHDVETDMLYTEPTATSIAWDLTVRLPDPNAQNLVFKELRRQLKAEIHEEVMLLWQ